MFDEAGAVPNVIYAKLKAHKSIRVYAIPTNEVFASMKRTRGNGLERIGLTEYSELIAQAKEPARPVGVDSPTGVAQIAYVQVIEDPN